MKFTLPVLLALAAKVSASPIESSPVHARDGGLILKGGEESILENPEVDYISALSFVGPITPGGPDVTLTGSAKDIYEQILELNPSYDVFDFPDYAADLESQGYSKSNLETADLTTRNPAVAVRDVLAKRAEGINCNVGKWIGNVITQCSEGLVYLRKLGKAQCGAKPKSCARVSCSNNCGMYLCSKFNREWNVWCSDIAKDINIIVEECGYAYSDWILEARGRKAFTNHNVELSSANC